MSSLRIGALAVALVALAGASAAAPTGAIHGAVFDQTGTPIRGVRVRLTAAGPRRPSATTYTDDQGLFRFGGLVPGRYDLEASAPKLRRLVQRDLDVKAGQPLELALMIEVEAATEEVRVYERAPMVSTTAPNIKETYDIDFVESMAPSSRSWFTEDGYDLQRHAQEPRERRGFNTEAYSPLTDNPFLASRENPLSTFSIDVDTASYANVRRFVTGGDLPPADAVRIEELVNYFPYSYPAPPADGPPVAVSTEVNECPWNTDSRLVRIGLRARDLPPGERPASNLVFLIDVSGSMAPENKLPLVQRSLRLLVDSLRPRDRVAMVVYAGSSGLVLPSTPASERSAILGAIDRLGAGGSTNGGEGIALAYKVAAEHFVRGGNNRVILATDGDFNVGVTSQGELVRLIEEKAKGGVFLTVLGFGIGNYKDATMEQLADRGNGNYAYVDSIAEARKVLTEQLTGTLYTVAKDVKLQIEWNPARVVVYRLIGYENRLLRKEDFNDDAKDAGELGAGQTVTALYEIVPTSRARAATPAVDPLRYQRPAAPAGDSPDLFTVKLRYKLPDAWFSKKAEWPVIDRGARLAAASRDFRFAAAVAAFGMLLRGSPHSGTADHELVLRLALDGKGDDPGGHRMGFVDLVRKAWALADLPTALSSD